MDHFFIGAHLVGYHNMDRVLEEQSHKLMVEESALYVLFDEKRALRCFIREFREHSEHTEWMSTQMEYLEEKIKRACFRVTRVRHYIHKIDKLKMRFECATKVEDGAFRLHGRLHCSEDNLGERFHNAPIDQLLGRMNVTDK